MNTLKALSAKLDAVCESNAYHRRLWSEAVTENAQLKLRLAAAERVIEAARELVNDSRCNGTPGRDVIVKLNGAMGTYDKEVGGEVPIP